jgi:acyl-CoA hydrolase
MPFKVKDDYKAKLTTAEEAAKHIKSGDRIAMPPGAGEPRALSQAIAQRAEKGEIEGVRVDNVYTFGTSNPLWDPKLKGRVIPTTLFLCSAQRWAIDEGVGDFTPIYYQDCPRVYDQGDRPLDVFIADVSPMDKHGYFTFGASVSNSQSCARAAKKVVLEVNEKQPRIFGDSFIHISSVDCLIEDPHDLPEIPEISISKDDEAMAQYIVDLIPDGACIQIGVGGVPNAVCKFLHNKKELGIHTELFGDTLLELIEKGVVTNQKKNIHPGKVVCTFALGSRKTYDYLDDNPGVESYQVDYTNNPYVIAKHENMVAINATLQVDLTGQCCSESIGWRQYSAVGGQADFARGAFLSKGGKSFLCLYSTAKNGTISTIVPWLSQGANVSTQRQSVMYIVTEYGVAKMWGKSTHERAKELINIAHPNFRAELKREAKKMKLL